MDPLPLNQVLCGDCREVMAGFPEDSIDLVVTSPPYWGLRDYGNSHQIWGGDPDCKHIWDGESHTFKYSGGISPEYTGQFSDDRTHFERTTNYCSKCGAWLGALGLEPHPQMFVDHLVEISREIKRIIKPRGSYWLNLGDTYYGSGKGAGTKNAKESYIMERSSVPKQAIRNNWLQPKQMLGIPWRVAIALQNDGWILRNCIIWYKRNHMPESVQDRLTKSYEFFFFFVKQQKYYFNLDSIRQPSTSTPWSSTSNKEPYQQNNPRKYLGKYDENIAETVSSPRARQATRESTSYYNPLGKNPGDMWDIPTQPFPGAHFAVFPNSLIEPIIKSSSPKNGTILDPFAGSGTALRVARKLGRRFIGIEINPEYAAMCERRVRSDSYSDPPEGVITLTEAFEK